MHCIIVLPRFNANVCLRPRPLIFIFSFGRAENLPFRSPPGTWAGKTNKNTFELFLGLGIYGRCVSLWHTHLTWNTIKLVPLSHLVLWRLHTGRNIIVSKIGYKMYLFYRTNYYLKIVCKLNLTWNTIKLEPLSHLVL